MASVAKAKFYTDEVIVKIRNRSDEYLKAVAFQMEAETKVMIQQNGQIDVGFMLNSIYTLTKDGDSYGNANQTGSYTDKNGKQVVRKIAPKAALPRNAKAGVVVGAEYAVYQEERKSFLYAAAEKVAQQEKGTAERKFKEGLK